MTQDSGSGVGSEPELAHESTAEPVTESVPESIPDPAPEPAELVTARSSSQRRRRWLRRGYQAVVVVTVLVFLPVSFIRVSADSYVRTVADVPAEPVGIVFGAAVAGGTPSPYLASRLDVALALWKAHKIKVFLVSGDNSRPDYNEPGTMRDYLKAHGVPENLIVLDYAGFDSWETCDRAKRVFGVDHAIVVSQSFHVPRAVYLCRAAGIDAYGVGDGDAAWVLSHQEALHDQAREVLAGFSATYQAAFTPVPTFLGRKEPGIADALRAAAG
jgi:vancomycin permeability regulator SanA